MTEALKAGQVTRRTPINRLCRKDNIAAPTARPGLEAATSRSRPGDPGAASFRQFFVLWGKFQINFPWPTAR
jgi:hypothetical protein